MKREVTERRASMQLLIPVASKYFRKINSESQRRTHMPSNRHEHGYNISAYVSLTVCM